MGLIADTRAAVVAESSPPLDPMAWASAYSQVDLFGLLQFKVNQQIGDAQTNANCF
jgi:hypothetical protein